MKQVYPNVAHLANSQSDRLAEFEQLCRSKVAEVLQAYLDAEADELVRRARYERVEEGAPVVYRNGHDPERVDHHQHWHDPDPPPAPAWHAV